MREAANAKTLFYDADEIASPIPYNCPAGDMLPLYVVMVTVPPEGRNETSPDKSVTSGQTAPISELRALSETMGYSMPGSFSAGRLFMLPCVQWHLPKMHLKMKGHC